MRNPTVYNDEYFISKTVDTMTNLDVIQLYIMYKQEYFSYFLDDAYCIGWNNGSTYATKLANSTSEDEINDDEEEDKINFSPSWLNAIFDRDYFIPDSVSTLLEEIRIRNGIID